MRRMSIFIAGAIGLLVWAWLVVAAGESLREDPVDYNIEDLDVPDPSELGLPEPDLPEVGALISPPTDETPVSEPARQVRAIEPEAFGSPAFADAQGLERVAPRAPFVDPADHARPKVVLLHRPASVEAGLIAFRENQTLRLLNISSTPLERRCADRFGNDWPCGVMARTQQRLFIRNRSLACETPGTAWQGEIRARCWLGLQDVSSWLAKQGWAEAEPQSALAALTQEARAERRGLFGEAVR